MPTGRPTIDYVLSLVTEWHCYNFIFILYSVFDVVMVFNKLFLVYETYDSMYVHVLSYPVIGSIEKQVNSYLIH